MFIISAEGLAQEPCIIAGFDRMVQESTIAHDTAVHCAVLDDRLVHNTG